MRNSCFTAKDQVKFEHEHDLVSPGNCLESTFIDNYLSRTVIGVYEQVVDHNGIG